MSLYISASGMANAMRRFEVTANNVANINTDGYQAARAKSVETPGGGARVAAITRGGFPPIPGRSNVDLATELTHMIFDRNAFQANAGAFRAQNQMTGELLNILI
jgi:flagellar basal body rod protein FlgG